MARFRFSAIGTPALLCVLAAVTLAAYAQAAQRAGFVSIDDGPLVTVNPLVQEPLSPALLKQIFH